MNSAKKLFYDHQNSISKKEKKSRKISLTSMNSTKESSSRQSQQDTPRKLLSDGRRNTDGLSERSLLSASVSRSSSSSSIKFSAAAPSYTPEVIESLLAELFASASSIKAAYVQLQLAQAPYDPEVIQSADLTVVTELRHVSDLKRAFVDRSLQLSSPLKSQIHEQQSLLKTYEITSKKLESDIDQKDSELMSLRSELSHLNSTCRELEAKLYPGKTLASLHGLHLSGLNPTHFLCALRFAVRSIKSFVRMMVENMKDAGWDLDAAAKAVHTGMPLKNSAHRNFYFESYVCNIMFSDFHNKDFHLESLQDRGNWNRTEFFDDFNLFKSLSIEEILLTSDGKFTERFRAFLSAKYLSVVQPRMELSFFKDLHQRETIKSRHNDLPNTDWFVCFAEMARRVWLLHCLFFSFGPDTKASIFQVRRGTRFSQVYMDSVLPEDESGGTRMVPTYRDRKVGFTVVPGFQVGMALFQARVYLISGID